MMFVLLAVVLLALLLTVRYLIPEKQHPLDETVDIHDVNKLDARHDLASAFLKLVHDDGAGHWPPRAKHHGWPAPLRPYREIYSMISPFLASADPSLDDELNKVRCREFRSRMAALLDERIDIEAVRDILDAVAAGNWDAFPRDAYNGFYSCLACLRHAYRWATNPVVKVAQEEKQLLFPLALDLPWSYMQRRFGITSPSGNIMANIILNFDEEGEPVYLVNEGMSEVVLRTEKAWSHLFIDSEVKGVPLYGAMIRAVMSFEQGDKVSTLRYCQLASEHLRNVLQNLYQKMNDPHVVRSVWVRHVSGIHSWGLTLPTDEVPIEYGGLSGSQILVFLAVDGFLGISGYHSKHEMEWHISKNMRDLSAAFSKYSFRARLSTELEDEAIAAILNRMVKQLRNFRAVHKVRAVRYLSAPAPERVPMTAALSVLDNEGGKAQAQDVYQGITGMLNKRIDETL